MNPSLTVMSGNHAPERSFTLAVSPCRTATCSVALC